MIDFISMAVPVFFILIGMELLFSRLSGKKLYRLNDTIANLSLGTIDQVAGAFLKVVVFSGYLYIWNEHRLLEISPKWAWGAVLCFIGQDFFYYWAHRVSHERNLFWAAHVVHHSSEEYNLAVALRQSVFQGCLTWFFYLPLAWIGFHPMVFVGVAQVNLLYQFWIHTRAIDKLGPFEWFFNTPSHHRVHHASNTKYIDKNHGGTLIIWDRIFGTFKAEEEEPVYGIVTPLRSWNPVWSQIHQFVNLARTAAHAPRWRDKLIIWFMPPAWRPEGLEPKPPREEVTRGTQVKFNADVPRGLRAYLLIQFVAAIVVGTRFMRMEDAMALWPRVGIAFLIILSLMTIGGIFESKRWAFWLEFLRIMVVAVVGGAWGGLAFGYDLGAFDTPFRILLIAGGAVFATWLLLYRRRFVYTIGPLPNLPENTLKTENA